MQSCAKKFLVRIIVIELPIIDRKIINSHHYIIQRFHRPLYYRYLLIVITWRITRAMIRNDNLVHLNSKYFFNYSIAYNTSIPFCHILSTTFKSNIIIIIFMNHHHHHHNLTVNARSAKYTQAANLHTQTSPITSYLKIYIFPFLN